MSEIHTFNLKIRSDKDYNEVIMKLKHLLGENIPKEPVIKSWWIEE
jgi:hypothetical protein